MPRAVTFKAADLSRAVKAARAAGLEVAEVCVNPAGEIRILTGRPAPAQRDELAEWRAARDARKAQGT